MSTIDTWQLNMIAEALMQDIKSIQPSATDAYRFGKEINRMARLVLLADDMGIADARQTALSSLEVSILPWLQNLNSNPLIYDRTYGGLVTTNGLADKSNDFGSGWYNDHHFHYGYFVHAAAVLARFDRGFFDAHASAFDMITRDICTLTDTDSDFPFARHKDLFDGHSWASGLMSQMNGKSQESSSEVNELVYYVSIEVSC